jgi:hypothetical protein
MDLQDVSGVDAWMAYLRKATEKIEHAGLRKGELVRDHPAPEEVMRMFMVATHSLKKAYSPFNTTMAISQIPPPYPPCTCSADDLQPLMISDLRLETHHRGFKIMLRIFTNPNHVNAITVLVEDEMTDILLLQLYNQPEESDVPAEQLIGRHRVCIIKEPYFKCSTGDGQYTLRVDHPSDIVWLADKDDRIPAQWKILCPFKGSSSDVRKEGNAAVKGQKWAEAERMSVVTLTHHTLSFWMETHYRAKG